MNDKTMTCIHHQQTRRRLLQAVGGSAAIVSVGGLVACGPDGGPESTPNRNPDPAGPGGAASEAPRRDPVRSTAESESAPAPAGDTQQATDAASPAEMPRLDPTDPQAEALAYTHDASSVDEGQYPRYEPGQLCSNCSLYTGEDGAPWGPCSIFPGKLVNADGWCITYAPKS